jgi:hypothetical protein
MAKLSSGYIQQTHSQGQTTVQIPSQMERIHGNLRSEPSNSCLRDDSGTIPHVIQHSKLVDLIENNTSQKQSVFYLND